MTEIQRTSRTGVERFRTVGLAGAAAALAVTAGILTGAGSAAAATPGASAAVASATPVTGIAMSRKLGPYVLSECLRRGNQGMVDDAWDDYECKGTPGHYYIHPVHKRRGGHR